MQRLGYRSIQKHGQVGTAPALHHGFQLPDGVRAQSTAAALVCVRGIDEPIAHHPSAGPQCGLHVIGQVHGACGKHEQQFRDRRDRFIAGIQHDVADTLGQGRASGLARHDMIDTAIEKGPGQPCDLGGFAHPLDPFNGQESPWDRAHGFLSPALWR